MKIGDKMPVTLSGHVVAQAVVHGMADGTATLRIPATEIVMGTRTDLTDLPTTEPSTETIIDGVDRPNDSAPAVETPNDTTVSIEPAPVETPAPAPAPTPAQAPEPTLSPAVEAEVNNA